MHNNPPGRSSRKKAFRSDRSLGMTNNLYETALIDIAKFNDAEGNRHFKRTGSYCGFHEPNSVRIARDTLRKAGYVYEEVSVPGNAGAQVQPKTG